MRKVTELVPGSEANQGIRVKPVAAHEDRFCQRVLDRSLRPPGSSEALRAAFSAGEPASRAYTSPSGPEERENPDSLAGWRKLKTKRFGRHPRISLVRLSVRLRI